MRDKATAVVRFAFVEFETAEATKQSLSFDGTLLMGSRIRVEISKKTRRRPSPPIPASQYSSSSVTIPQEIIQVSNNQSSVDQTHQMQSREMVEEVEHISSHQAALMERDASLLVEAENEARLSDNDDGIEEVRRVDEMYSSSSGITFKYSQLPD